jgi:lysyl-tRNA synthetase class 2
VADPEGEQHDESELIRTRREKLARIVALGYDPFPTKANVDTTIEDVVARYGSKSAQELESEHARVRIAGRILLIREFGKTAFLVLSERTARIQVYCRKDALSEREWELYRNLDAGDWISAEGTVFRTKTNELSVKAEHIDFLVKALRPLPGKWHGLTDVEQRYRQRYVDLIVNDDVKATFILRAKMIRYVREWFDRHEFIEVETPMMQPVAGGAAARPFITHHNALDIDLFLRIALELHLKRLLVGGMERVFEIGRVYRNEGLSPRHNPEFTMMEAYQAYADYGVMMELTESLICGAIESLGGQFVRPWGETTIDFTPPWPRRTYAELVAEHAGVDPNDFAALKSRAEAAGITTAGKDPDVVLSEVFEAVVEDRLTGPVFVIDYPAALCPLTKRKASNPKVAERFELFVQGTELANAYTELNDPQLQETLFKNQLAGLPAEESMAKMDDDFVRALKHGMPPAGGIGVGIDRLCMLLFNQTSVRDVILFPLLRPQLSGAAT